jgi:hypothetical protein
MVPLVAAPVPRILTPLVFMSLGGWLQQSATVYFTGSFGCSMIFGTFTFDRDFIFISVS